MLAMKAKLLSELNFHDTNLSTNRSINIFVVRALSYSIYHQNV